jgi:hypothetical protein
MLLVVKGRSTSAMAKGKKLRLEVRMYWDKKGWLAWP